MSDIMVNGQIVSPEKYEEYKRRTDIVLHQVAPSIYITLTQTDLHTHEPFKGMSNTEEWKKGEEGKEPLEQLKAMEPLRAGRTQPIENKPKEEVPPLENLLSKKKGRIIMEEGK